MPLDNVSFRTSFSRHTSALVPKQDYTQKNLVKQHFLGPEGNDFSVLSSFPHLSIMFVDLFLSLSAPF